MSLVTPNRAAKGSVFLNLRNAGNFENEPRRLPPALIERTMPSEEGTASKVYRLLTESQRQNLDLTVLYVPYSLDTGDGHCEGDADGTASFSSSGRPIYVLDMLLTNIRL